jgi:nitrogen fixation NifU-like protein|tara:strand:- start:489 stop:962 length:474 start_codon:yes stop_codon:yes gene_type:complete
MNLKELYQEIILDHGKNPRNLRKTDNFNKDAKGHNPLCGDKVHVYLKLDESKKVEDISFEGQGCAISMASASIMTSMVKGKEEHEVKEIVNDFLEMIKEKETLNTKLLSEDEKTKLMCLSGVKQYPMRVKCATLSWHTLTSAIDKSQNEINMESMEI